MYKLMCMYIQHYKLFRSPLLACLFAFLLGGVEPSINFVYCVDRATPFSSFRLLGAQRIHAECHFF